VRNSGMDIEMTSAAVVPGDEYEVVRYPTDEILLRVADRGDVQVAEYRSTDRVGGPTHQHEWHEIEYVIEGEVEFWLDGSWHRAGPGAVQVLPAGVPHNVRVPEGEARVLMVTIGAPYDQFARDIAALGEAAASADLVATANRHGVQLA
jgi:mannose-6-phosphate isomerase-like protein (cupin superfamily)